MDKTDGFILACSTPSAVILFIFAENKNSGTAWM